MTDFLEHDRQRGLGRLCADAGQDRIITAPTLGGIERIEARFSGNAYDLHRHDTYAIGLTLHGVQTFRYRGVPRHSLPGQVIVLHPDEMHDGGAGTEAGLRYRMLYIEPALVAESLGGGALPFVKEAVIDDADLAATLGEALEPGGDLLRDDLVCRLGKALSRHGAPTASKPGRTAWRAARLARDYLADNALRAVSSRDLEEISGLDRYALSRHFRAAFATSPHRYQLMRRLEAARHMIHGGDTLAEIAVAAGFSDQSHFNRHFKKAFGVTPGRWAALARPRAA